MAKRLRILHRRKRLRSVTGRLIDDIAKIGFGRRRARSIARAIVYFAC
jgi:hypothetical protein